VHYRPGHDVLIRLEIATLHRRVKFWLSIFVAGLVISGLTAFPLEWEADILQRIVSHPASPVPRLWPDLAAWIATVNDGLHQTYHRYPFLAYGTDWLAFAHLVIAVAFWGPLRDPVRNRWVIEFGMIACLLVLPPECSAT